MCKFGLLFDFDQRIVHGISLPRSEVCVQSKREKSSYLYPRTRVLKKRPSVVSVNAVLNTTKEWSLMLSGILCLIIGYVLIRGVLPDERSTFGAIVVVLIGLSLLFFAQRLIWKSLDLFYVPYAPAHSDYRPVEIHRQTTFVEGVAL